MGLFGRKKELYTPTYQLKGDEVAVLDTSKGTIKVKLDGEGAPIHVANFCELATTGFYDGLKFHRYVPGFVIQGGCPNTRNMTPEQVAAGEVGPDGMPGTGGPGYCIKQEFSTNPRNKHVDGALAMARSMDPGLRWIPVLLLPGSPAQPRQRLHRVRHHHRGHGRHCRPARGRHHQLRHDRESISIPSRGPSCFGEGSSMSFGRSDSEPAGI